MHILDVARNSIDAGANRIVISIEEDTRGNILRLIIKDNGIGMDKETLKKLTDPFFTTKGKKNRAWHSTACTGSP